MAVADTYFVRNCFALVATFPFVPANVLLVVVVAVAAVAETAFEKVQPTVQHAVENTHSLVMANPH